MPPAVATTLNQILIGDVASSIGTGTRAAIPGHPIAGKTGTSQDRFSVAFVGYTPQYAASVMVLNPKHNQDVGAYGGRGAAPIWHDAMLPILSAQAAVPFPPAGLALRTAPPPPPRPRPPPAADDAAGDRPSAAGHRAARRTSRRTVHRTPRTVHATGRATDRGTSPSRQLTVRS